MSTSTQESAVIMPFNQRAELAQALHDGLLEVDATVARRFREDKRAQTGE